MMILNPPFSSMIHGDFARDFGNKTGDLNVIYLICRWLSIIALNSYSYNLLKPKKRIQSI